MSESSVFILGAGFIGQPLATEMKSNGYDVSVSIRSKERNPEFVNQGISVFNFEVGNESINLPQRIDVLVISYPIGSRKIVLGEHLKQAAWIYKHFNFNSLKQVILTSSTSVYPDGLGEIDETCTARPDDYGLTQLEYEEALRSYFGDKLLILRLAGLIGKNRHPGRFLASRAQVQNPQSPVNMVHQGDVIRFVQALVKHGVIGEIFNLCHHDHPPRKVYYRAASKALGLEPPVFSSAQIPNPKVIKNNKSKSFFGFDYEFPIDLF